MLSVKKSILPNDAFLQFYLKSGAYTDCYVTQVKGNVSLQAFVLSFYTTWIFKLERVILKWLVAKPSTDQQAQQLSTGKIELFAAWRVERRDQTQLLMCDFQQRTRSWLMVESLTIDDEPQTYLYFGSAVVAAKGDKRKSLMSKLAFCTLFYFHKIYSQVLLYSAKSRISQLIKG